MRAPATRRWKSAWIGRSVTGSTCTSRGMTRVFSPSMSSVNKRRGEASGLIVLFDVAQRDRDRLRIATARHRRRREYCLRGAPRGPTPVPVPARDLAGMVACICHGSEPFQEQQCPLSCSFRQSEEARDLAEA